MKLYAPDKKSIEALLRRPQMYVVGNRYDGVVNLMFGIRIVAEHHAPDDQVAQGWRAFEEWMQQRQEDKTEIYVWTALQQQYADDETAMNALRDAYAEYVGSLGE